MAGFELSPEHEAFRRSVRDVAVAEIAPYAGQWDADHHHPPATAACAGGPTRR